MSDVRATVSVDGDQPYRVVLGHGLADSVADLVPVGAAQAAVIHAPAMSVLARSIGQRLSDRGVRPELIEVPDAEAAKTVAVSADVWSRLGERAFTRSDAIVGVGGGATTDLAGFVAATWLRGVAYVAVPTTLLGMVDAAVGGKTGINTAEGKNLVGAFHPPVGVVCDLDVLTTLPVDDYRAGLAEVVKCGFTSDPVILDLIAADPADASLAGNPREVELITRAVAVKADVVARDLREATSTGEPSADGLLHISGREVLNYGHTLAHAIEQAEGYTWRHGDAVSVGLVYAAEVARLSGILDDSVADRHGQVLHSLGLPVVYADASFTALRTAMGRDKKARGSTLRLVLLAGLADPVLYPGPDESVLAEAFARVSG